MLRSQPDPRSFPRRLASFPRRLAPFPRRLAPFTCRLASFNRRLAVALAAATLVAGCATTNTDSEAAQKSTAASNARGLGQVALLRAIGGSAVTGKVRVVDRGDGATLTVAAFNLPIGDYRISINRDGNCSSPNGFSTGPAWAPSTAKRAPSELVGVLGANSDGSTHATVHVAGLRATGPDGVAGRSVVLYAGRKVTEAQPGIPNDRIACGVFEPTQVLQF